MQKFLTHTTVIFPAPPKAALLAYKKSGSATVMVNIDPVTHSFTFPSGEIPGIFQFQITDDAGGILSRGEFELIQNLQYAGEDFDPRSTAEITLEALEAKIAGRALTIQQASVSVDGRSIQYMNSIDELTRWRDYFKRIVAKEKGHGTPTHMTCYMVRG